jgi:hypothetical protein
MSVAPEIASDDPCLIDCDENQRGFENNRRYHGHGGACLHAQQ